MAGVCVACAYLVMRYMRDDKRRDKRKRDGKREQTSGKAWRIAEARAMA